MTEDKKENVKTSAAKKPAAKKTTAASRKKSAAKKTTAAKKTAASAKKTTTEVKKTTAAAKKTTAAKKTAASAKETTTEVKKTTAAAKKTTAAKKTAASAKKTTAEVKKTTAAAKKTTAAKKTAAKKPAETAVVKEAEKQVAKTTPAAEKQIAKTTQPSDRQVAKTTPKEKNQIVKAAEKPAPKKQAKAPEAEPKKDARLKILYCTPECVPFASSGGLGEVAGSLPKALNQLENGEAADCRVIMPLYEKIPQEYRAQMTFMGCKDIPVAWRRKYMGVLRLEKDGVVYYFIDNEEYFGKRDRLYGYYDDCERFAFFSRAVFEALEFIGPEFNPSILHANDWQTALVPVYQDAIYRRPFCTTVYTIHNIEYQGHYGFDVVEDVVGLPHEEAHLLEFGGDCNLMKGAIECANLVTTVSPSYANELKDPYYAFGLDGIMRENECKLRGILNGINTEVYDPRTDKMIAANYDENDLSGKLECKRDLQKWLQLPERDVPVITLVSRLVAAKGIDLIVGCIDDIIYNNDCQFVMLGTGDARYESFFHGLEERHRDKVRCIIKFDTPTSHRIYSAGDILLMPSKGEPCGLAQMIGCRYGDVPLVRATGGLRDSIKDCTLADGNGFVFQRFDTEDLRQEIHQALIRFWDRENWKLLVAHDLVEDFTWNSSAKQYLSMYDEVKYK